MGAGNSQQRFDPLSFTGCDDVLRCREQDRCNGEVSPCTNGVRQGDQGDEAGQQPSVLRHGNETPVSDELTEGRDEEHGDRPSHCLGDRKQVGLDDVEPETPE